MGSGAAGGTGVAGAVVVLVAGAGAMGACVGVAAPAAAPSH